MYSVSKLKNDITLIRVPVKGTKAVTVLAMFPVGSRYEEKKISGISHFVEHIMFKGTVKRPTTQDISRTLDAVGAQYNAFTSKEYTGYYVKIAAQKQELAFDVLSDILFNSEFKAEEIEKEKGAIVEELRMYRDNPLMDIETQFENHLFGDNSLGRDIGGTDESVRSLSREDLWNYYQKHYSPKNMVVAVAGALDTKKMKKYLSFFEGQIAPKVALPFSFYKKNFEQVILNNESKSLEKRIKVNEKKVDQAQFIMGFLGLKINHPDQYALAVLSTILGGGMSSRLFIEVRERRGLAYMVRSSNSNYRDMGAFYIQAGLDPSRITEAVQVITQEIEKIKNQLVEDKELEDAKSNISGKMALEMEDCHNQAQWYAEKFLFSPHIESPDEVVKKIKQVTKQDVRRVARNILQMNSVHYAAIGSFTKEQFLKFLK